MLDFYYLVSHLFFSNYAFIIELKNHCNCTFIWFAKATDQEKLPGSSIDAQLSPFELLSHRFFARLLPQPKIKDHKFWSYGVVRDFCHALHNKNCLHLRVLNYHFCFYGGKHAQKRTTINHLISKTE